MDDLFESERRLKDRVRRLEREKAALEETVLWLVRREVERMGGKLPDVGTMPQLVYETMVEALAA